MTVTDGSAAPEAAPDAAADGAPGAPSETTPMRARAIRSSLWTMGTFGAAQVIRFVGNLALTRLLFPDVFGLMALVTTFLVGLQLMMDIGIGPAIIQSPKGDDPTFLRTAWTVQVIRGGVLWVAAWAIAYPVAAFYHQPLLGWLIPASAFSSVIGGFESTAMQTALRHLRIARYSLIDLAGQAIGVAATVALAALYRRTHGANDLEAAWMVVFGMMSGTVVRTVLTHTWLPGIRQRFQLDRAALVTMIGFAGWILVSTLLTFLSGQLDRLLFGRLIPLDVFGVYGIAAALAMLPTQIAGRLSSAVLFPACSRAHQSGELDGTFRRWRLPVLLAGAAIIAGLIAAGPFLIGTLYDSRYRAASWIIQFLAVGAWFQILEATNGSALLAQGRVSWHAANQGVKVVAMLVLVPLGFHLHGFEGALVGFIASDVVKYVASTTSVALRGLSADLLLSVSVAGSAWIGYAAGALVLARQGSDLSHLAYAKALGVSVAVAGPPWGAVLLWYARKAGVLGGRPQAAVPVVSGA